MIINPYIEIDSIEIDAILNNSSAVVMATKDNVTDEQVTERINKVISNNESLLNLTHLKSNNIYFTFIILLKYNINNLIHL